MSITQKKIIEFLRAKKSASLTEIAEHVYYIVDDARLKSIRASLKRLVMGRFISEIDKGVYVLGVK